MKTTIYSLTVSQTVIFAFLNCPYSAELNYQFNPVTTTVANSSYRETSGINPGSSEISSLNRRAIISATLLGIGLGASWFPVYVTGENPALGFVVGPGTGGLMGFTTSYFLTRIQPDNWWKGMLLGMGLGAVGGMLSGMAAGSTAFPEDAGFNLINRTGGMLLGGLGGITTGLLSGGIFCSIYGSKIGRYTSTGNKSDMGACIKPPRIVPVKGIDNKVHMRYDMNLLTLTF